MPRSRCQLRVCDPQIFLLLPLLARPHRHAPILQTKPVDTSTLSVHESKLAPRAVKAMAAKLARLVYRMLRYGMPFIDRGAKFYDAQHRKLQINYLKRKAANLGFHIIEAPAA